MTKEIRSPNAKARSVSSPSIAACLAVAVVALRRPRRVQRRTGSRVPLDLRKPSRRCTRRYPSQRDEFYHAKLISQREGEGRFMEKCHYARLDRLKSTAHSTRNS